MTNTLGFILTVVYIFAIIGLGEGLRRWRGYGSDFTRKVVHIGVGMVMWLLPSLFTSPWPFALAAGGFMLVNLLDWRFGFFAAMASTDRQNLGTVYFPFATLIAAWLFWERPNLMIAAIMPLTWGDGLAPVIGRRFGKRSYTVFGHTRTIEGSLAFFMAASVSVWLALWLGPGPAVIPTSIALALALGVAGFTALVEAVTPYGLDNLTVTGQLSRSSGWSSDPLDSHPAARSSAPTTHPIYRSILCGPNFLVL